MGIFMKLGTQEHLDYCARQQESCRIATSNESLTVMDRVGAQIGELDWMAAIDMERERTNRHVGNEYASAMERMDSKINADLLAALKLMIEGEVVESHHAVHPSKRFCKCCGRNSEEYVHSTNCPVSIAEIAIAKAECRNV